MSGIHMMLKSMGFDPDEFLKSIQDANVTAGNVIQNFDTRLKALEEGQARIEKLLEDKNQ